ncbi:MAG: hypothetical protein AB4080_26445 [Trichodesmium sp.]
MREEHLVVRQGSVGSVGSVGRVGIPWKVGRIIVPVSVWEVSATRPRFLVLKAEKFALFSRLSGSSTLIYQRF